MADRKKIIERFGLKYNRLYGGILVVLYSWTMNLLRALKHRPFALLWTGQTTSRLGDSLYRIALSWWVLEKTGSAIAMGTVLIFSQIPLLLFVLIGGVVVDRLPRIRIMFTSDTLSGLVIAFVAVFAWLDILQIWHIYIASMLFGFVEAFFFPAYQAVIPQLTPPEFLTSANSLNGLSQRITGIVGPTLGAALVAAGGTSITFGLDALSFFISAFCVLPILRSNFDQTHRQPEMVETMSKQTPALGTTEGRVEAGAERSVKKTLKQGFTDLLEGFRLVTRIPWIWINILLFGVFNIMEAGTRAVALPFLVKEDLGADVGLLGLLG
ncbi:MAG TPA: MFS transporter, partial [Anaerolineales bacterium]|nr:MFS transporter [Anaerolineales bacterium]